MIQAGGCYFINGGVLLTEGAGYNVISLMIDTICCLSAAVIDMLFSLYGSWHFVILYAYGHFRTPLAKTRTLHKSSLTDAECPFFGID